MPSFIVTSPSGKKYRVNGPEGSTREEAIAYAQQLEAREAQESEDEDKRGVGAGFARGARQFVSDVQTAFGSILDGEEAALAGIKRGEDIARERGTGASLEELKKRYAEEGALGAAKEVGRSIPEELAAQAPQIAASALSAQAGAAAGAALGGPAAPLTGTIGGLIGLAIPSYLQQYAGDIERQVQEDIAAGREVDVSRTAAAVTAVPQAAADVAAQLFVIGRVFGKKIFGEATETIYDLLKKGDRAGAEKLAKEGLAKTVAKGTVAGGSAEIITEATQSALERAQAGLPVTSDDAFKEYGEVAYKTALLAPLGGAGRVAERAAARRGERLLSPDMTATTPEQRSEIEGEGRPDIVAPQEPLPDSLDDAPLEVKAKLRTLDTPQKAAEFVRDQELQVANMERALADDPDLGDERIANQARKVGLTVEEMTDVIQQRIDRIQQGIPYARLKLKQLLTPIDTTVPAPPVAPIPQTATAQQQLIEPAPPAPPVEPPAATAPTTPMPAIPQGPEAQQTLQIDQAVAQGLGLPGAEVAPKNQPFTVTTETAEPIAPISQAPGAQQSLGMEATAVVDPLYEQAVNAVIRTGTPTIPTLQRELQIGFNRAARLLEQMQVEGVITPKDRETGQRQVTMGQRQEAPSATAETSQRVAEQAQLEPVGGGTVLPPSGAEPAGRVSPVTPVEGVEPAVSTAADVVPREGRVEPALGELPQITETRAAPTVSTDVPFRRGQVPPQPVMSRQDVETAATESAQGWTNAPEIVVLDNENDTRIPKGVKIAPSDKGFYHEGKTYVIASRALDSADVHATVFHESLGHFGLRQKFRERLDDILNDIYETNPVVRVDADANRLPGMSDAQAVEEVLAIHSEFGQIKEAGIRAAFNRVAAFIRRVGRAMGIKFKYSNNDVVQIIRIAQEKVTKGRREYVESKTVEAARKQDRGLVNLALNKLKGDDSLIFTPERVEKLYNFYLTKLPDKFAPFMLAVRNMRELSDIFGDKIPSIKALIKAIASRVSATRELRREIGANIRKWNSVLSDKKYAGVVINKFYRVAIESTEEQIDFRRKIKLKNGREVANPDYNSLDPLTNEFESLPEPLRKVYFEILDAYKKLGDMYVDLITKTLPPTIANKIRQEIESRRLKIYLPLYRHEGNYWLAYDDRNGKRVVETFGTRNARSDAQEELRRFGATNFDAYEKIEELSGDNGNPYGFFTDVSKSLETYYQDKYGTGVPPQLKGALYDLFLDNIPASSVRQQFRRRQGLKGADKDLIRTYSVIASRMANQLGNLEYSPIFEEIYKLIKEDVAKFKSSTEPGLHTKLQHVQNELKRRIDFFSKAVDSPWIRLPVYGTYVDYILGNVSSGIINSTNIPLILHPLLLGRYRNLRRVNEAVEDAIAMYLQGGWDSDQDPNAPRPTGRIAKISEAAKHRIRSDRTIFDPNKVPPNSPLGRLYKEALAQGALKHSLGYDIIEARDRKPDMSDYMGTMNLSMQALGWVFHNTERFNREVSLVATFRLEMEKARSEGRTGPAVEKEAIDRAIDMTNKANGESLTELDARVFQIAPLKVFLTFKRFARAIYALNLSLLKDALVGIKTDTSGMSPQEKANAEAFDRQTRKVAASQLVAMMGTGWIFAGLNGMPFSSMAQMFASGVSAMLAGFGDEDDDDEIRDKKQDFIQSVGTLGWHGPVNQIFGVDMASRTGFTGLLWRDDPRRIEEIGVPLFVLEQAIGPIWQSVKSREEAAKELWKWLKDEDPTADAYRAIEKALPVALRNMMKAWRYAEEGVVTPSGKKVVDDLNEYELFMQAFGFTPTRVTEAYQRAAARKEITDEVADRRSALMRNAYVAWMAGDEQKYNEAIADIGKWNNTKTATEFNAKIDWKELGQSFRTRSQDAQRAVDGFTLPKRYEKGAFSRVPKTD